MIARKSHNLQRTSNLGTETSVPSSVHKVFAPRDRVPLATSAQTELRCPPRQRPAGQRTTRLQVFERVGAGAAPLRPASGPAGGAGPRRGGPAASPAVPRARNRGAGGCEAGGRTGRRERAAGPLGLAPGARAASVGSSRAGAGGALPRRGKPGTGRAPGRRGAAGTMTTGLVLPLLLLGLSGALRVS